MGFLQWMGNSSLDVLHEGIVFSCGRSSVFCCFVSSQLSYYLVNIVSRRHDWFTTPAGDQRPFRGRRSGAECWEELANRLRRLFPTATHYFSDPSGRERSAQHLLPHLPQLRISLPSCSPSKTTDLFLGRPEGEDRIVKKEEATKIRGFEPQGFSSVFHQGVRKCSRSLAVGREGRVFKQHRVLIVSRVSEMASGFLAHWNRPPSDSMGIAPLPWTRYRHEFPVWNDFEDRRFSISSLFRPRRGVVDAEKMSISTIWKFYRCRSRKHAIVVVADIWQWFSCRWWHHNLISRHHFRVCIDRMDILTFENLNDKESLLSWLQSIRPLESHCCFARFPSIGGAELEQWAQFFYEVGSDEAMIWL